jgi:hypothetical protein
MSARTAAIVGVVAAVGVAGLAITKRNRPVEARVVETTTAIRIVRRDGMGLPEKKGTVRDHGHVRALTEALGIDAHREGPCPLDYADADIGIVLSGNDVYAKRNVYVFALLGDAGAPSVVSVTSGGCRVGSPADVASLERELRAARILE